jgi:hypothetical protein
VACPYVFIFILIFMKEARAALRRPASDVTFHVLWCSGRQHASGVAHNVPHTSVPSTRTCFSRSPSISCVTGMSGSVAAPLVSLSLRRACIEAMEGSPTAPQALTPICAHTQGLVLPGDIHTVGLA